MGEALGESVLPLLILLTLIWQALGETVLPFRVKHIIPLPEKDAQQKSVLLIVSGNTNEVR